MSVMSPLALLFHVFFLFIGCGCNCWSACDHAGSHRWGPHPGMVEWSPGVAGGPAFVGLPYGHGAATPGLLHERSANCHLCYFGWLILSAKCNPDRHFLQSVHFKCGGDNTQSSDQNGDLPWGKASWKNMLSWHDFFFFLVWFFSHLLIISSISPFPEHDNTFSLPYLCSCFSFCNAFSTYLPSHLIL